MKIYANTRLALAGDVINFDDHKGNQLRKFRMFDYSDNVVNLKEKKEQKSIDRIRKIIKIEEILGLIDESFKTNNKLKLIWKIEKRLKLKKTNRNAMKTTIDERLDQLRDELFYIRDDLISEIIS